MRIEFLMGLKLSGKASLKQTDTEPELDNTVGVTEHQKREGFCIRCAQ